MQRLTETYLDCNFEILEDERGKPLRVGGEMQLSDRKNANGRIYSEALWRRVMEHDKTKSRLKERRMVGELDHPASGKTSVERISHVMTSMELKESKRFPGVQAVYGVYECIPTPNGKILETLHRHKIGVAVSSRGDGDLEERGGESYVIPESYELDTFDAVMDPSVNVQVGVLESKGTCPNIKIPGRSAENLIRAIYGIVESGNFDREAAAYYKTILENVHPDGSEAYLMATEALKELTEHLEVTKVMKTPTGQTESSNASGLNEQQVQAIVTENTELKDRLQKAEAKAHAGQRLCQELLITARAHKMQSESAHKKLRDLAPVAERYESAKQLIAKMRESILGLQQEGKLRVAAERLLGALLSKIDESKRTSYVDRILAKESVAVRKELRPVLLECENKSAVNRLLRTFKGAITEARTSRGLPPVTENGKRNERRIPSESPLLESNNDADNKAPGSNGTPAATPKLQEQVDFTKRLLRAGR